MLKTQTYTLSIVSGIILMLMMIIFGTTAARAENFQGVQKGTAHYQLSK